MAHSNAAFKKTFGAQIEQAKLNMDLVVRKVAMEVLRSIVMKSPVDTGRFRGNWFVQEQIAPIQSNATDKSGGMSITAGFQQLATFTAGGRVFILNHLPYSIELENGHSQQAPKGMVRITVVEFERYLRSIAAQLPK